MNSLTLDSVNWGVDYKNCLRSFSISSSLLIFACSLLLYEWNAFCNSSRSYFAAVLASSALIELTARSISARGMASCVDWCSGISCVRKYFSGLMTCSLWYVCSQSGHSRPLFSHSFSKHIKFDVYKCSSQVIDCKLSVDIFVIVVWIKDLLRVYNL